MDRWCKIRMTERWKQIFQVAATYIGTVVGAGFASGQEILNFFTRHGSVGALAILLSTILFIWLGRKVMAISHEQGCYSYQELNQHLFGKKLSWLVNGVTLLILFGTTGVMLSGTGSIFEEQFHMPFQAGILITIALCLLTMYRGMNGVMWVNSLVVPMMIFFTIILAFHLFTASTPWWEISFPADNIQWVISPILYVGFNLAMAQAVLVPLGTDTEDPSILHWGGFFGGLGLGLMLLVNHLSLQINYQAVQGLDIPMAQIIANFGKPVVLLFTLVVFGEIFTTIIGNVFGLIRQAYSTFKISQPLAAVLIMLGSFIVSQWGFRHLVDLLYPVFGAMGLLFMLRLMFYRRKIKA